MKQKYVLTAVAVVAVGAVALGTAPMWEGTNSVKQEETRTSIIEDPVNTETEVTGTPTPLPTTARLLEFLIRTVMKIFMPR